MESYQKIVPSRDLVKNRVLDEFLTASLTLQVEALRKQISRKDAIKPEFVRAVAPWLGQRIGAISSLGAALDCFEAATAEEVYRSNAGVFAPMAVAALRRGWVFWQQRGWPLSGFVQLACERGFWGQHEGGLFGRPFYRLYPFPNGDWHKSHQQDLGQIIAQLKGLPDLSEADLVKCLTQVFGKALAEGRATGSTGSMISGAFRLGHIWLARIDNRDELEWVIRGLEALERRVWIGYDKEVFNRGMTMFTKAIEYCAQVQRMPNAQAIHQFIATSKLNRRTSLSVVMLLKIAAELPGAPIPPERTTVRPTLRVPAAMDAIADFMVQGPHSLSETECDNIMLYCLLAGDVCALGEFLRDKRFQRKGKTIGDYLAEHPRVDPEEFADRMNPQRVRSRGIDPAYAALRREFGAVVYWKLKTRGFGRLS